MSGEVRLPDLPAFAAFLGRRWGCSCVVALGDDATRHLGALGPRFETVVGVGRATDREAFHASHPSGSWVEWDFGRDGPIPLGAELLSRSIVVCAGALERLDDPAFLLSNLRRFTDDCPVCLIATPDRDRSAGPQDAGAAACAADGPPAPRWNLAEFERTLRVEFGFNVAFVGFTAGDDVRRLKDTVLAVIEKGPSEPSRPGPGGGADAYAHPVPPSFRVVALIAAYNEGDIIVPSLAKAIAQGVEVYLLDNWSTDGTYELARSLVGQGVIRVERFPHAGPPRHFNMRERMIRLQQLAQELDADWFMFQDVDEVRKPPWPGVTLREAIYRVDSLGYNCIDHTNLLFHPVDNGFVPGTDFEAYFTHYEIALHKGWTQVTQLKAWKNTGRRVFLAHSVGHEVVFEGRRVYPYNFLNKHYPFRSQEHGERKVFRDRQPRWIPEKLALGWHVHHDHIKPGYNFIHDAAQLSRYDEEEFNRLCLVERLSSRRWS